MFDEERTEHDGKNALNPPQTADECGDPETGTRAVEDRAVKRASVGTPGIPRWKRVLDVCCVLFAIPALLPLSLIIAALIKLTSKGPILFKQERVGFLGKKFTVFKYRTMIVGADTADHEKHVASLIQTDGPMTKLDKHGDKRLIPIGRLLRASGLDELPQLINVLRGEMSIVGPRPCLPGEYQRYQPWQKERLHALPGLTGLWQVSGKNRLTFTQMMECDIRYVRTQSLRLDLRIMLKTIPALIAELRDFVDPTRPAGPSPTGASWM
jgi:lipopolysaccharide/colanic/teichoic acid biosynthesis glycosyltransferase